VTLDNKLGHVGAVPRPLIARQLSLAVMAVTGKVCKTDVTNCAGIEPGTGRIESLHEIANGRGEN
jgi:hypothetical protein